jgi:uncharacterized protein HemX
MLLASKMTDTIGVIFVILVIVSAFGISIWQWISIKNKKKAEEEHRRQMKAEKLARKNKGK